MQLQQHAGIFGRPNLRRNLQLHHNTTASPATLDSLTKNAIERKKTPNNRLKTARTARNSKKADRKLERTVENLTLPIKTQTNGRNFEITEQNSSERWKT